MYRLNINSQKHGIVYLDFNTQTEVDNYLANIGTHWGELERTEVIPATEEQAEQTIIHPATATYSVEDITAKSKIEKSTSKNMARIIFGQRIMAELAAINQQSLENGQTSVSNILSVEEKLVKVQRLLLNGSLGLALNELINTEIEELSESIKNYFVSKIQTYLNSEA
ncbi:MAG: hypothetical protein ACK41T_00640 [Pseudobdellovibrio sp.]